MNLLQLDSFRFCLLSFSALASRSGCGATISDAVARTSIAFCDSVSADRIVMAASRLLRAVAVFVILLPFAAGLRKSYWSGCMKAATVICQQIFSILASVIFLLKILLKSASKSSCTTTVRGWTTKSRTTKFSADNTFISGKLCGPLNQSLLMLR